MKKLNLVLLCLLSIIAITSCDKEETLEQNETNIKEGTSLFYAKDDMNGMDMITDNVDRIFFIGSDSLSQGTIIEGGKMDINSDEWIKEEAFVVYVDSLNRITSIMMDGWMCNFYDYTESTCDIAFINGDGTYESIEDISLVPERSINNKTRSVSGENLIDGTLKVISGVKSSLELALSVCKNSKSLRTAFNAFDYVSGMFSGGISFGMNSASMGLKAHLMNIKPDLFSLCVFLIESGRTLSDFLTEQLIGNWELYLINVEQTDANTAEIVFRVSGVKDNPSVELSGYVWYMNTGNRDANTILFKVENNTYKLSLPLNSYGNFVGSVSINGALGFFKRKEFKFDAFHLGIKSVIVEDNPLYENGTVNFLLSVYLEGSEDGLNNIQQFGYYTRYANSTPDYRQVNNLSSIFQSTPLIYTLSIDRNGFFRENMNYSTFVATADGYYIGAYVVLNNGNIIHLDEQLIKGLIYNTKPSIGYNKVTVGGTSQIDSYTYEDGSVAYKYKTVYTYEAYVIGAFWISDVSSTCSGNYTFEGTGLQVSSWEWRPECDGKFNNDSGIQFWDNNLEPCIVSLQLTLGDGSILNADNSLYIIVNPTHTSISIIGSRSAQQNASIKGLREIDKYTEFPQLKEETFKRIPTEKDISKLLP